MAFEDDMIDAGFYDEESYLESLFDEEERRMDRQLQRREEEEAEEEFLDSLDEDELEAYIAEKLWEEQEERKERERRRHRHALERERELNQKRKEEEIRNSKLKELQALKEQWLQENGTDVVIWNELEKQEDKHDYFYDELNFLQRWYGWTLCREEFREWKANNKDIYIKLEAAFENLRSKGYSTKDEYDEFTWNYIFENLRITKIFDYRDNNLDFGELHLFDYHKRVQQFNIWKTENEDEWHRVLESLDKDQYDLDYISFSSDEFIKLLVLNDNRYSFGKVVALLDANDYCNYSGRINKLTDWEELYLRKKYFPEYYDDIIRNIQTYIRTLNEMSVFSHYQLYNSDFLKWLMTHKEMDITQQWIATLKHDSAPIYLNDIGDLARVFMGIYGLRLNYIQLESLVNKTSNAELLNIWKEEGEFLKEYNDWLYYIEISGQYEDFIDKLGKDKLLQEE